MRIGSTPFRKTVYQELEPFGSVVLSFLAAPLAHRVREAHTLECLAGSGCQSQEDGSAVPSGMPAFRLL